MRKSEIADLITMARGFDDRIEEVADPYENEHGRIIEDARVSAWHLILGDIDVELAERGLAELYRAPQMMRLQPGHIFEAAERVRRRNVAAADLDQLQPPQEIAASSDPGEGSRTHLWRQAAIRAVGRGLSVEEAQIVADDELEVSRKLIGPSRGRQVLEEKPRGLAPLRTQMGETA
ncbi:hypothetical protein ACTXMZ_10235 [Brachybacterium alimentarium]|uniref:hypothetical protein n=1 Tax=Brachybacterium alimentarium TaxID=47845 RepID=UPI003FD1414E